MMELTETVPQALYGRVIQDECIQSGALAKALHTTKAELAASVGLSPESLRRREREYNSATQRRLRDAVEVLNRVSRWTGSDLQAYAWFLSEPLPSFGQRTASELVAEDMADAVKTHLARIALGGFA